MKAEKVVEKILGKNFDGKYVCLWDPESIGGFLEITNWPKVDVRFMKRLFYLLGHESDTLKMARKTQHFAPEIRSKLDDFKASYLALCKVLLSAEKCSEES